MKYLSSVVFVALAAMAVTAEEEASQCSSKFAMEFQNGLEKPLPANETLFKNRTLANNLGLVVCPNLEEGSCCTNDDFKGMNRQFNKTRMDLFNMTASLKLGLEDRVRYYESLGNFTEQKLNCQSFKNVTSVDSDNFKKTIGLLKNATLAFPKNFYQCAKAGLRFQAGYNCLRCQPDSDMFIDDDTSAVMLHNDTCASIEEKCGPLFMNLNNYLKSLKMVLFTMPKELREEGETMGKEEEKAESFPEEICHGEECGKGLCQSLPVEGGKFDLKKIAGIFMQPFRPPRKEEIDESLNKSCEELARQPKPSGSPDDGRDDTQPPANAERRREASSTLGSKLISQEIIHAKKVARVINNLRRESDTKIYIYSDSGYESIKTGSAASFDLSLEGDSFEGVAPEVIERENEEEEKAIDSFDNDASSDNGNGSATSSLSCVALSLSALSSFLLR